MAVHVHVALRVSGDALVTPCHDSEAQGRGDDGARRERRAGEPFRVPRRAAGDDGEHGSTTPAVPTASTSTNASASVAGPDAGAPDAAALLRAEGAILARAREAMDREQWQTALRELRRHARSFPHGKLAAGREQMMQDVLAAMNARDGGAR